MTLRSRPIAVLAGVAVLSVFALAARGAARAEKSPAQGVADPTAALLVELIRANTSNPPGNTGSVASLLAPKFKVLGFQVDIIQTPDSGKAHFIVPPRLFPDFPAGDDVLTRMTLRSNDQFNATIYGHSDRMRGIEARAGWC